MCWSDRVVGGKESSVGRREGLRGKERGAPGTSRLFTPGREVGWFSETADPTALVLGRRRSALGRGGGAPTSTPRPPGLAYKAPARRRSSELRVLGSPPRGERALRQASPRLASALRTLPVGTMRRREVPLVPLVLLALVLCLASRGSAAPVTAGKATARAKMYPRGNHWAVGECPARSSLCGASRPQARVSASPAIPAARPWGGGFAPTFRPKRPPCPASREAVGPSRCLPFSPGHPPSTQRFQIPEITLRGISLHHPLST